MAGDWEDPDSWHDEDQPWRGDAHPSNDWPEPEPPSEYWLFRRLLDEEDGA